MMDEPEGRGPLEPMAPLEPLPQPPPAPPPERDPFWSYGDLLIFAGLAIPCMLLGFGAVKAAFWIFHLHPAVKTWELLAEQVAGYGLLFGMLVALFRVQYDRPFWRSLGWVTPGLPFFSIVMGGVGLAMADTAARRADSHAAHRESTDGVTQGPDFAGPAGDLRNHRGPGL